MKEANNQNRHIDLSPSNEHHSQEEEDMCCSEFEENEKYRSKKQVKSRSGQMLQSNEAYLDDVGIPQNNRRVTRWQLRDRVLTPENLPVLKR